MNIADLQKIGLKRPGLPWLDIAKIIRIPKLQLAYTGLRFCIEACGQERGCDSAEQYGFSQAFRFVIQDIFLQMNDKNRQRFLPFRLQESDRPVSERIRPEKDEL